MQAHGNLRRGKESPARDGLAAVQPVPPSGSAAGYDVSAAALTHRADFAAAAVAAMQQRL